MFLPNLLHDKIRFISKIVFYSDIMHLPMTKINSPLLLVFILILHAHAQSTLLISSVEQPTCASGFAIKFNSHNSSTLPIEYCLSFGNEFILDPISIDIKYWKCDVNYAGTYCPSKICYYSIYEENVVRN